MALLIQSSVASKNFDANIINGIFLSEHQPISLNSNEYDSVSHAIHHVLYWSRVSSDLDDYPGYLSIDLFTAPMDDNAYASLAIIDAYACLSSDSNGKITSDSETLISTMRPFNNVINKTLTGKIYYKAGIFGKISEFKSKIGDIIVIFNMPLDHDKCYSNVSLRYLA